LVMARKILERLGGTVSIEAAPDAGCRVQLQLKRV
jgi:C4-dicarboxylate-specific signal transduction histidine kinase